MPIIEIQQSSTSLAPGPLSRQQFNEFVHSHPLGNIHQLYEWGEFQTKTPGRDKFWALALEEKGKITASALLIRQTLPFGKSWLYCPGGPLLDYANPAQIEQIFTHIAKIAKDEKPVFLRFDPPINQSKNALPSHLPQLKSRPAHAHYQPENTLVIDLTPSESEILAQMKPKGRYNIKVAQKHGITIRKAEPTPQNIAAFYDLFAKTTQRDHFSGHPQKYYADIFAALAEGPEPVEGAALYFADYPETNHPTNPPLAAAIITYFNKTATYYFGASSNEHRNTMAPYLLHWHIMQEAKAKGYQQYDLFGIAPQAAPKNHPWAGVTEFKLKFGGTPINYLPAQEIIYRPFWYFLIKTAKKILGRG